MTGTDCFDFGLWHGNRQHCYPEVSEAFQPSAVTLADVSPHLDILLLTGELASLHMQLVGGAESSNTHYIIFIESGWGSRSCLYLDWPLIGTLET